MLIEGVANSILEKIVDVLGDKAGRLLSKKALTQHQSEKLLEVLRDFEHSLTNLDRDLPLLLQKEIPETEHWLWDSREMALYSTLHETFQHVDRVRDGFEQVGLRLEIYGKDEDYRRLSRLLQIEGSAFMEMWHLRALGGREFASWIPLIEEVHSAIREARTIVASFIRTNFPMAG